MLTAIGAVLLGLGLLLWSADRFVEGAASVARYFHLPPLLIGMVIIGFGTSAPEMIVSAISAMEGNPGLAIGNAYGSNIANIALILGISAMISPLSVHSGILKKELPVLSSLTILSIILLSDLTVSHLDAAILLGVFALLIGWSIYQGLQQSEDSLSAEVEIETASHPMTIQRSFIWLIIGVVMLVVSSRILVWGAVTLASLFGISDMVIGLTIVAIGTSLPELAASIMAAKKGEHDLAIGNVLGSNIFNTLAVVGIAAAIQPIQLEMETLTRDMTIMGVLTLSLFIIGYGFRGRPGRINRFEGAFLLTAYIAYTVSLLWSVVL
ncbi:MAG: calcium/sodium antiporter [Spirochaetia bacterium]|nr:calcium/sodium antiporter [Spirochaetia bacterium]MCF7940443.1 calcium/sodium antiporter [Spirochaetia bacterium]